MKKVILVLGVFLSPFALPQSPSSWDPYQGPIDIKRLQKDRESFEPELSSDLLSEDSAMDSWTWLHASLGYGFSEQLGEGPMRPEHQLHFLLELGERTVSREAGVGYGARLKLEALGGQIGFGGGGVVHWNGSWGLIGLHATFGFRSAFAAQSARFSPVLGIFYRWQSFLLGQSQLSWGPYTDFDLGNRGVTWVIGGLFGQEFQW